MWLLPEVVVREVLCQWVPLKSLINVDSAVCSGRCRQHYLAAVNGIVLKLNQRKPPPTDNLLEWLGTRGLHIHALALWLPADTVLQPVSELGIRALANIKQLVVKYPAANTIEFGTSCVNYMIDLQSFTLHSDCMPSPQPLVCAIGECCRQLHVLDLTFAESKSAPSPDLLPILVGCEQLLEFSLRRRTELSLVEAGAFPPTLQLFCMNTGAADKMKGTNEALLLAIARCPRLRTLAFVERTDKFLPGPPPLLTDHLVVAIGTNLPNLQVFAFTSNRVTWSSLNSIAHGCLKLHTLHLSYCLALTEEMLSHLLAMPCLTTLKLKHCGNINGEAVCVDSSHLESLTLEDFIQLSNAGLMNIAHCCPALVSVVLQNCAKITEPAVVSFVLLRPRFKLFHCRNVSIKRARVVITLAQAGVLVEETGQGVWTGRGILDV